MAGCVCLLGSFIRLLIFKREVNRQQAFCLGRSDDVGQLLANVGDVEFDLQTRTAIALISVQLKSSPFLVRRSQPLPADFFGDAFPSASRRASARVQRACTTECRGTGGTDVREQFFDLCEAKHHAFLVHFPFKLQLLQELHNCVRAFFFIGTLFHRKDMELPHDFRVLHPATNPVSSCSSVCLARAHRALLQRRGCVSVVAASQGRLREGCCVTWSGARSISLMARAASSASRESRYSLMHAFNSNLKTRASRMLGSVPVQICTKKDSE